MMNMEWPDVKDQEIESLREAVEKYVELATVTEEVCYTYIHTYIHIHVLIHICIYVHQNLQVEEVRDFSERNRLTFGRLRIPNSVQVCRM